MRLKPLASKLVYGTRVALGTLAAVQMSIGPVLAQTAISPDNNTNSPIKHVIVIIGENRSFDHVFATYKPTGNNTVWNLLSEGIVNADGTPGPNFATATQSAATDVASNAFLLNPPKSAFPNNVLPAPLVGGPKDSNVPGDSLATAIASESGLPLDYYPSLIMGGTGQTSRTPDLRITNVNSLPPARFSSPTERVSSTPTTQRARFTASTRCGNSWIAT
jgi:phospholipase C